jgi:hypothetical protein
MSSRLLRTTPIEATTALKRIFYGTRSLKALAYLHIFLHTQMVLNLLFNNYNGLYNRC